MDLPMRSLRNPGGESRTTQHTGSQRRSGRLRSRAEPYGSEGWGFKSLRARPGQRIYSELLTVRRWARTAQKYSRSARLQLYAPCLSPMACLQHRSSWSQTRQRTDAYRRLPGSFAAFGCRVDPYFDRVDPYFDQGGSAALRRWPGAMPGSALGPPGARRPLLA
jgi:hypothetical protein